ncbi:MAG: hypothetical protein H0T86_12150 [Gemmatimonadales bacterium]|nr:hypothetical protein [Gemmatimonadales bacterium]
MSLPQRMAFCMALLLVGCGEPSSPTLVSPAAPTPLAALELPSGDLEVRWRDNSSDESGFELQRSAAGPAGSFASIATLSANLSAYEDGQIDGVSEYCYRVRALGADGAAPSAYSAGICHRVVAPSAPSGLAATATFGQVDLSWTDHSSTEAAFEVWRSTTGVAGAFALHVVLAADATTFSAMGLDDGAEYCFQVRAVSHHGLVSDLSAASCATTPVPTLPPPSAPSSLTASPTSSTATALVWTDTAGQEQAFEIWRSLEGASGTYVSIATLPANTTATTDGGLTASTEYCYRVRAIGSASAPPSGFSNTACTTTPAPPPPATPSGLVAAAATSARIELSWDDNATDEAGYAIWRSTTGSSGSYALHATLAAGQATHSDQGLGAATQYCYKVRALGGNGAPDSPLSTHDCATTNDPTVVRVVTFGDSNTDTCVEDPARKSSYVGPVPRLAPADPHMPCQVAGKVEVAWRMARTETIRAVNHGIGATTTGGGGFGGPERASTGAPQARTMVNGITRYEAEVLGEGYPWSGGEPVSSAYPAPVARVNAYTPGPDDFVYVSLGTNDASNTRNMTVAETEANLRWMIAEWLAAGREADHFMLTTLAPRANPTTPTAVPDRNARIRVLAGELGVHVIELAGFVSLDDGLTWRDPALHNGDGTHYTEPVRIWLADEIVSWMSARTPAD